MTRSVLTQHNMCRSSEVGRSKPLARIIQKDNANGVMGTQSVTCLRPNRNNMTAASASKTVDRATLATAASPASALSP